MMVWHDGYGFWGGGFLWLLLIVLAVVGVAVLIAYLTRPARHAPPSQQQPPPMAQPMDPALQILRERFARGEIDQAEYEERRRALGG